MVDCTYIERVCLLERGGETVLACLYYRVGSLAICHAVGIVVGKPVIWVYSHIVGSRVTPIHWFVVDIQEMQTCLDIADTRMDQTCSNIVGIPVM